MSNIDKIKAKVEELINQATETQRMGMLTKEQEVCIISQLHRVLSFIDSLEPEESNSTSPYDTMNIEDFKTWM